MVLRECDNVPGVAPFTYQTQRAAGSVPPVTRKC